MPETTPLVAPAAKPATSIRPIGVTLIALLQFLGAGLVFLIMIIFSVIGFTALGSVGSSLASLGLAVGWVLAVLLGGLTALFGWGMWTGKNWARVVVGILSALGVLGALSTLVSGDYSAIWTIAINGLIAWYLLFNARVKAFFGHK